jgi:hypothetical protein
VARLLEYDRRGAMIADFDEAVAELVPEASAGRYEEALANLGASFPRHGAHASNPHIG